MAGRSNAGKSSALNRIAGSKSLARTSKTPGRTQLINYFRLGEQGWIVDLPGYGYAKVPDAVRKKWGQLIESYFRKRESLTGLLLVMDIRHPMTDFDQQMLDFACARSLQCHILLTKCDKLSHGAGKSVLMGLQREYPELSFQLFSAKNGYGLDEARTCLLNWLAIE